jgi:hypothetical protein
MPSHPYDDRWCTAENGRSSPSEAGQTDPAAAHPVAGLTLGFVRKVGAAENAAKT